MLACDDSVQLLQTALGEAVRNEKSQERDQGVVALAKKAQDLYRQQQEIIKKADQKYAYHSHALLVEQVSV